MLLRKIELRSFRQFVEADIDFDLGITMILGANGSGKTTLLEAVKYALYGECRGKLESLPNMQHGGKMSVAIEFDLGNIRYRCERDKANATLRKQSADDWETIAFTLNGVKEQSAKLLGLTCEQFCSSYFTEQKEIEFLKFAKARQKEQISQMLGIELLAAACKSAKETAKTSDFALHQMLSMLESRERLEHDLAARVQACASRRLEHGAALKELGAARQTLKELEPLHTKAAEALEIAVRIRNREDFGRQLKAELESFEKELEAASALVAERKTLEKSAKEFSEASAKHADQTKLLGQFGDREKLQFELDAKLKEIQSLETAADPKTAEALVGAEQRLAVAVKTREEALSAHVKAREEWQKELRKWASVVESCAADLVRIRTELAEVEAAEAQGVCPTCGQKLPDGHAPRSDSLRKEISATELRAVEASTQANALQKEPAAVTSAAVAEKEAEAAVSECQHGCFAAKAAHEKQLEISNRKSSIESEIAVIRKKIADCPTAFDRAAYDALCERKMELESSYSRWLALSNAEESEAASRSRYQEKQRQFDAEKAGQARDKARIDELGLSDEKAKEIQREFAKAENAIPHLQMKLEVCEAAVKAAEGDIEECETRLEKWKENSEKVEEHRHNRDLFKEVGDAMQELRARLNADIRPTLAAFASETLMQITDNRYSRVHIDESFKATLYDGDHRKSVISGGEEDVLALALRIALSRYVQEKSGLPLSMLVLDEVFGSLDSDRKQNVLEMFDGLKSMFPQIILISHVENLTEHADRILQVRFDPNAKASVIEEFAPAPALL